MFSYEPGSLYFKVVSPSGLIHHSIDKVLSNALRYYIPKGETGLPNMNSKNNAFGKMFISYINIQFNASLLQEALRNVNNEFSSNINEK